jgi:antitoxin component YwqK of YwqJK toxin-antitoxin module
VERIDIDGPDVDYDDWQLLLYRGEYFTGEAVEYFPDGALWTLTTYDKGFRDGPDRQWYAGGALESEGVSRRNRAIGEWKEWFPDGRLRRVDVFDEKGNLQARRVWNEAGELVEEYPAPAPDYGPEGSGSEEQ